MSNWDPYGESATSLMKISVYSEDEGIDLNGIKLVIGDMVTESLETNNTINWTFADNKKDALELIQSGECYAGIIIPKDFTKDMLSIMNGNIVNPSIEYYENSKKNAIATKITGKVKTTVQNEINTKLISTLTEIFANAGDYLSGSDIEGSDIISGLKSKLNHISSTLDNYIYMMNTFALLTESASDSIDTTKLLFPNIDSMASSGADSLGNLSDSVDISKDIVGSALSLMNTSLDTISSRLDELSSTVNNITVGSQGNSLSFIKEVDSKDPFSTEILDSIQNLIDSQSPEIADAKVQLEKLKNDLELVKELINGDLSSTLTSSMSSMQSSLSQAQSILSDVPGTFSEISSTLTEYQSILNDGKANVQITVKYMSDLKDNINSLIQKLDSITASQSFQEIMSAIKENPQMIVDFISSPVQMNTVEVFAISNYGSAMAPFYTVLALWVGALILVALIHVKVKDSDEIPGVKPYQKFFGRYISFFVIGQVQTIITVFGDLFYVGIQCKHPIAFTLAAMMTSFVFTFLIYSLTVAFGNIGEAIAVVIMVIQVAGAGGTFPVEVLPSVYQYLYKFMPFSYCMNALRECVAGMYQHTYGKCLATLLIYVGISVIIGLLLAKPCAKLLDKLEHSKEKSGLFI